MNEELTNEVLEAMTKCNLFCPLCGANEVCSKNDWKDTLQALATALLEERAKPKDDVWKYAPDWATQARVEWDCPGPLSTYKRAYSNYYTRELPKTRARQIAEEVTALVNRAIDGIGVYEIESILNKYAEELTNTKETN